MLSISIFSDFQLHAETFNKKLDKGLIFNLKLTSFVQHFLDEDLEFDSRAVFRVDELPDCIVEVIRVTVEIHIQISELVEDELFSLSVLKEKESN